jgi:hypothetical protein
MSSRAFAAQQFDLVIVNAAKTVLVGDRIDDAQEPRKAVGQRSVQIEDGELVSQGEVSCGRRSRSDMRE